MTPKKCSIFLRRKIRAKFLEIDFKCMDISELLLVWTSFKKDYNSPQIHYKFFNFFNENYEIIKKNFDKNPKLALNIMSTYAFNHLEFRFRKTLKRNDEVTFEKL